TSATDCGFQVRGPSRTPLGARRFETLCRSVCPSKRSSNACVPVHPPDHSSRELSRTLRKRFASVSPGTSGHRCQTDRAPMLVGTPLPVKLSVCVALGPALWIRRVLVRSQEGQLKRRPRPSLFIAPP